MKKTATPAAGRAMTKRLPVPLTAKQHRDITAFAKRNKIKMATWARKTLLAAIERRKSGTITKKEPTTVKDLLRRGREKIRARQAPPVETGQQTLPLEPAEEVSASRKSARQAGRP